MPNSLFMSERTVSKKSKYSRAKVSNNQNPIAGLFAFISMFYSTGFDIT